jgi:hypothetical protein
VSTRPIFILVPVVILLGFCCLAQQMPYSLAYTYTAVTQTYDGSSVTSTSVANTYGTSGHTAAAATAVISPSNRTAAANMYQDYQSSATTYLAICSGDDCEDGTYTAYGSGEEYCPITYTYMMVASTQASTTVQPFIEVTSASVQAATIPKQNGTNTLTVRARKTSGCAGGTIEGSLASAPGMAITLGPPSEIDPSWNNNGAVVDFSIKTSSVNEVTGTVEAGGIPNNTPCTVRGRWKTATFSVN